MSGPGALAMGRATRLVGADGTREWGWEWEWVSGVAGIFTTLSRFPSCNIGNPTVSETDTPE